MMRNINWPGLLSIAFMLLILYASLAYGAPWWRLEVGDGLGHANVSPLDIEIEVMGNAIDVPLLKFITFGTKATWAIVAAIMLVYSLDASPKNSKTLLNLSYRKPVYYVAAMILIGLVGRLAVGEYLQISIPFVGTSNLTFHAQGDTVSMPLKASLTWLFWAAMACASLSVATRLYHEKFEHQHRKSPLGDQRESESSRWRKVSQ